ncbi:ribosomal protection-like ABC-F family protein [Clostridium hydrogeniformans]|uniref:ribosomal protection-like ABC-F family protein n=1 Tax=Clostridium hydrogeniformans TaxID=349933 RepID=UPI000483D62A|nr:ABC-F family ATP-binding cassette domain-containing protein [Clostridium hydrogeniformans]
MTITIKNLYKDYKGIMVFKNINCKLNSNDRIGLIGGNGVGKTTLCKIIAGIENYECGAIVYSPSTLKVLYLNTNENINGELTVHDVLKGFLSSSPYSLEERFLKSLLYKTGLKEDLLKERFKNLSGGEKTKVLLCRAYIMDFNVLILDEPTNHLDITAIKSLEGFITSLNIPVILISHDRYFLDNTCNKIWCLNNNSLKEYKGHYSSYKIQLHREVLASTKAYNKEEKEITSLKSMIEDRKTWFHKAHKAAGKDDNLRAHSKKHIAILRSKEKQLKKLEENRTELPSKVLSPTFNLINKNLLDSKLPKHIGYIKNLNKSFGNRTLLKDASFNIKRGDKIALLGDNGCGKTTLLKILIGEDMDYSGEVYLNPSIKISYFSQGLNSLDEEKSIVDNLLYENVTLKDIRNLLASFLFKGEDVFKTVKNLSMGEKSRVALSKLLLSNSNFLILDEITNYMDIESKETIEEVLKEYKGNIIFVSHDRYFTSTIATKILEIKDLNTVLYPYNYDEYIKTSKELKENNHKNSYVNSKEIKDNILMLQCEIAFLSGKLSRSLDEEEKIEVNNKFLEFSKEISILKSML